MDVVQYHAGEKGIHRAEIVPCPSLELKGIAPMTSRTRREQARLKKTAYHEAGHAFVDWYYYMDSSGMRVTIVPNGLTLGGVSQQGHNLSMMCDMINRYTNLQKGRTRLWVKVSAISHAIGALAGEVASYKQEHGNLDGLVKSPILSTT